MRQQQENPIRRFLNNNNKKSTSNSFKSVDWGMPCLPAECLLSDERLHGEEELYDSSQGFKKNYVIALRLSVVQICR